MITTISKKSAYGTFTTPVTGRRLIKYGGLTGVTKTLYKEGASIMIGNGIPTLCAELPGGLVCAERNWRKHSEKAGGCQCGDNCASSRRSDPEANLVGAEAFRQDPAAALCCMGYHRNKISKKAELVGSTGQGLGHLADAHAIGRSTVQALHHRFPKTIV